MPVKHYDVIILGGGNAGFGVSAVMQETGKSIAFVESDLFGGTCPNRGCTPKKVLVAAAHVLHEIEMAAEHGIEVTKPTLNWSKLIEREQAMISFIPDAMKSVAGKRGDVYVGHGQFIDEQTIEVNGQQLRADHIVIATGSTPRDLPIPGAEHMVTSDKVFTDKTQPDDVVFIGGGVIAMEFSHVYARAGSKVTILEALPQLLPRMDQDAVAQLQTEIERIGVTVNTSVKVISVQSDDDRYSVTYESDGVQDTIVADRVINGAGRVANVSGLDLEAGNVANQQGRIEVDNYLRSTSNPHVWVAGDALAMSPQLSPLATEEGRLVGENIVHGPQKTIDYTVIPNGVYTVPAYGFVGLTEAEAKEQYGDQIEVTTTDLSEWFSAKSYAETVAWAKVIIDLETDRFVGAHMVGHRAEELIHLFSFAMQQDLSPIQLKSMRFAFPTFSSDVRNLF